MNFWNMQLHPNDKGTFNRNSFNKVLETNIIGMGASWDNDGGQPGHFKNMSIGDIVLLRHDGPKVLVEVIGGWQDNGDKNVWFDIMRPIRVLSQEGELMKKEYESLGLDWQEGLYNGKTFIKANNSTFIQYWYDKIVKQEKMNKYVEFLKKNKNLILTGAPGTGKTYLAREIANAMITDKATNPLEILKTAINNFQVNIATRKERKALLDDFYSKFPYDKITNLTLDEYCNGKGDKNNFCWWLETGLKQIGSFAPAQRGSYVYGIFFNNNSQEYKKREALINYDDKIALNEILETIRTVLVSKDEPEQLEKAIKDATSLNYFDNGFLMKILTSYGVKGFIPIHSLAHLKKFAETLELDVKQSDKNNIFKINQALYKLYEQLTINKNISPVEFMDLLYGRNNGESVTENHSISSNNESNFVQFHPSYDYTDFVEGLRPIKKGDILGFELKNGIFKEFCKKALLAWEEDENKDNKRQFVFIIDEINRAEISKVFGELFYSIDPGYRGEKGRVKTQYSNIQTEETCFTDIDDDYFYVPENVYIIGTMNDIDRSVESFDFAMRRRFAWVEVTANDRISMWDGEIDAWKAEAKLKMEKINKIIEDTEGLKSASYHIGPSYFLKLKEYNGDFKQLWDYHIGVILKEYLRGMPDAKTVLNDLKKAYGYAE